jgi:hypothetical protein
MSNQCLYCEKYYSNKPNLSRHQPTCPALKLYHSNQNLKKELVQQQTRCDEQKEYYEQKFQTLQEQHEKEIRYQREFVQNLQEQHEKEIQSLKEQLTEFKAQLFEIAKQPKQVTNNNNNNTNTQTTNNRILNITNNLVPMDLTDEQIREILKNKYTREIFLGGPDSITEMTVSQLLTDQETGKFRIVCTDASRNVFYYQDCDENLVKDIGMEVVHKKIQKPLVEATSSHFTKIDNEKSMDDDELCILLTENMSFIDHELPNKLKRKLQLPVNAQE